MMTLPRHLRSFEAWCAAHPDIKEDIRGPDGSCTGCGGRPALEGWGHCEPCLYAMYTGDRDELYMLDAMIGGAVNGLLAYGVVEQEILLAVHRAFTKRADDSAESWTRHREQAAERRGYDRGLERGRLLRRLEAIGGDH
jgi:hypothetical protein